ncbi:sugar ABC transporter substrate-binding protein [Aquipuribacter nitratireducens]|uniref:Extracellular solute-binding protein n=1 Tax=Aquipuribacter nitratireducens TaxID=650104 RepID=A0ABW0GPT1_9MICO
MRRRIPIAAMVAGLALVATACGDGGTTDEATAAAPEPTDEATAEASEPAAEPSAEGSEAPIERADADLVIWTDETRAPIVQEIGDEFGAENDLTVAVQQLDFGVIRDQLIQRGPVGEGPDIIIGAHDWLGQLVTNGAVAPLELGDAEGNFQEVAVEALSYEGVTYGLPYAVENVALFRNTALAPEAPADFQSMLDEGQALVDAGDADLPLALQVGEAGDVYHFYPIQTSFGSQIFRQNEDGSYNPDDLQIDNEGGIAFAEQLAEWGEAGLINPDVTFDIASEAFASGRAPYAITGPWNVPTFTDGGVEFVVEAIPSAGGEPSQPFVGVQGFMVSAYAENPLVANDFVLNYLGTEEVAQELYETGQRPPAFQSVFDEVSSDPIIAGFGEYGATGQPLPNIPAMNSVWGDYGNAQRDILLGNGEPATLVQDAAERIRAAIAGG